MPPSGHQPPIFKAPGDGRAHQVLQTRWRPAEVSLSLAVLVFFLWTTVARGQSTATVNVNVNQPGALVSSNLFGIFYEEINFAGEGGIYAEMVRNRTFHSSKPDFWTLETQGDAVGMMSKRPLGGIKHPIIVAATAGQRRRLLAPRTEKNWPPATPVGRFITGSGR